MGYTTKFTGQFDFSKQLMMDQFAVLNEAAHADSNPADAPDSYCQWVPTGDGKSLRWDGNEKFYEYTAWLKYLVEHYFQPWGITLSGKVQWQGEETDDVGVLSVKDNIVTEQRIDIAALGEPHEGWQCASCCSFWRERSSYCPQCSCSTVRPVTAVFAERKS